MKNIEKYEVVKQYNFVISGLGYSIHARIVKILDESYKFPYSYEISHYCRTPSQGGVYVSDAIYGDSIDVVEGKLMYYLENFKSAVEIVVNEMY